MDSNAFINALYCDVITVRPLANAVNYHLKCSMPVYYSQHIKVALRLTWTAVGR